MSKPDNQNNEEPSSPGVPHNREAEEAVLGSILISPNLYYEVAGILKSSDFYIHRNGWIFDAIGRLANSNTDIDLITLSSEMDKTGEEYGGSAYLTKIITNIPSSMNALSYARIVSELKTRRGLIQLATKIASSAYSKDDINEILSKVEKKVYEELNKIESSVVSNTQTADEASLALMNRIMSGEATGINSGFGEFDDYVYGLGGFPRGGITLFLGDSSYGKSSWVIQLSEQVAFQGGKVIIFGYEQPNESNVSRRVFGNTGINYKKLRSGKLTEAEKELLQEEIVNNYQGRFTKKGGQLLFNSLDMTLVKIKNEIRKHRPDFVVIDQFKFIRDTTDNGNITLSYIANMTELKNFAKEFNCHVIAVQPITAEESKKFLEANAKANNGAQSGANVKNVMPDVNAISWAKELKFIADIILFVVPEVHTKFGQGVKLTNMKMIIWILKDRDGDRFVKTFWDFDLVKQWWTNEKPPQTSAQQPSAVTAPKMQSAPPPAQVMPEPPEPPEPPDYEFEDIGDDG